MEERIIVRDLRPGYYRVANELVQRDGAKLTVYGIGVYNAIASHAGNETNMCYISVATIAKELGIVTNSARKYTRLLEYLNWIAVVERINVKTGRNQTHEYYLLDVPEEKELPTSWDEVPPATDEVGASPVEDELYVLNETTVTIPDIPEFDFIREAKGELSGKRKIRAVPKPTPRKKKQHNLSRKKRKLTPVADDLDGNEPFADEVGSTPVQFPQNNKIFAAITQATGRVQCSPAQYARFWDSLDHNSHRPLGPEYLAKMIVFAAEGKHYNVFDNMIAGLGPKGDLKYQEWIEKGWIKAGSEKEGNNETRGVGERSAHLD